MYGLITRILKLLFNQFCITLLLAVRNAFIVAGWRGDLRVDFTQTISVWAF